jgi:hypothetical protein
MLRMTLALGALERPRFLQDFRKCCHHARELDEFNCCPVNGLAALVGPLARDEAAAVPEQARSAAVKRAAAVVSGCFARFARYTRRRGVPALGFL